MKGVSCHIARVKVATRFVLDLAGWVTNTFVAQPLRRLKAFTDWLSKLTFARVAYPKVSYSDLAGWVRSQRALRAVLAEEHGLEK